MQPLRVGLTNFRLNLAAFAFFTCAGVIIFSSAIRLITTSRRSMAALRLFTGLLVSGFCTRPASIAACAKVSSSAWVEK